MKEKLKNKIAIKHQFPTGILVLDNKTVFKGIGLGYQGTATGEICFNTSLTGYQEIISDPSYAGQIINFTFPHIGNVGINNEDLESDKVWTRGAIFNSEITSPSNYRALKTLDEWLKKNKIVGLTGLDTRSLTNFIRDKGAPKGTISNNKKGKFNIKKLINNSIKWPGLDGLDLAIIDKRRDKANESEVMNIIGDVDGKECIVPDDIIDTAGTLCNAAKALKDSGASKVSAYITHPVLSGPAIERISNSEIDELVVTNSIPLTQDGQKCSKIRVISIAPLLSECIKRLSNEESLSAVFL